jgi:endonuclease I/chitodextrinase
MKKLLLLFYFITITIYGQVNNIPATYYNTATGAGYTLKTQLYNIIKGHTDNGYGGLYTTYATSDIDRFFEKDGTVLDMYSENPAGVDPYNYTPGVKQCGSYSVEGDCYNREHIIPQSLFNSSSPMVSDAHFITPTDGKVNGYRSNYPHGMVGSTTYTSRNGSKLGLGSNTGYAAGYSGTVFEPIDEFKGDIARMYFYFATRYENVITSWGKPFPMFDGTANKVFTDTFLSILMTWHAQDPVSATEIERNKAIYARQLNRNPFIDHPEYVAQIWSTTPDTEVPSAPTNLLASNITNTTVNLNWTASTDNIGVVAYLIYKDGVFFNSSTTPTFNVTGLTQNTTYNFTVYAKDLAGNTSGVSNTANVTTTNIIDTENPSAPTNLVASSTSTTSTNLNWTAATDNVGVVGYEVYKDGVFLTTTTTNSYNVIGLSENTTYNFTVYAKDGAGNKSSVSNTVIVTTLAAPPPGSVCGTETFTNLGTNASSYITYNWTGDNGVTWSATDARNDQVINSNRAITIRNGLLTSGLVAGGIAELTVTTQRVFTGGSGNFNLLVNGEVVGTIPYSDVAQTTTITGINISGSVIISLAEKASTTDRVAIDNLTWKCYSEPLSVNEYLNSQFIVYPNPTKNQTIFIAVDNTIQVKNIEVMQMTGKMIKSFNNPIFENNVFKISELPSGFYILKMKTDQGIAHKKIIVN